MADIPIVNADQVDMTTGGWPQQPPYGLEFPITYTGFDTADEIPGALGGGFFTVPVTLSAVGEETGVQVNRYSTYNNNGEFGTAIADSFGNVVNDSFVANTNAEEMTTADYPTNAEPTGAFGTAAPTGNNKFGYFQRDPNTGIKTRWIPPQV